MPRLQARKLRLTMTDAERRLWAALRGRRLQHYKFRRQHPLGPFIVDFACIEHRLIIEADGGQHADSEYDRRRSLWLERRGWQVIRFWNNDILTNSEGVQIAVLQVLEERGDQPSPHLPVAAQRAPSSPASGRGARGRSANRSKPLSHEVGEGGTQRVSAGRVREPAQVESE